MSDRITITIEVADWRFAQEPLSQATKERMLRELAGRLCLKADDMADVMYGIAVTTKVDVP